MKVKRIGERGNLLSVSTETDEEVMFVRQMFHAGRVTSSFLHIVMDSLNEGSGSVSAHFMLAPDNE